MTTYKNLEAKKVAFDAYNKNVMSDDQLRIALVATSDLV